MALFLRCQNFPIATFLVVALFLGKGSCDSTCPNGITNITRVTSGKLAHPSSGNYGINETKCWRIEVPKPYKGIRIINHTFEIEECSGCQCDRLKIASSYNDLTSGGVCGRKTSRYLQYLRSLLSGRQPSNEFGERNIYIRFASDDTVQYKGFNFSYIVHSQSYGQASYLNASGDETIEFSTPKYGIKNYPANFAWQWFLIVPEGRQVQITFEAFELEQSDHCENDYLEVREAYFRRGVILQGEYGAILAKPLCGSHTPSAINMLSAGNMVWVQFRSDSNATTTYKGFKASFKAGQGRLSISNPLTLLFISALLVIASKDSVFY